MAYCGDCDRYFRSGRSLEQHLQTSSAHNYCGRCEEDFTTWTGLKEHWVQSPNHHYCQYCDEHFEDSDDLEEHFNDAHYRCKPCNRFFKNSEGLHQHYRQHSQHAHLYCIPCKILFKSEANLRSHLKSSTHLPRDVPCPGFNCDKQFISKSALFLHIEVGGCPSGITRSQLNSYVRQVAKKVIADPSRLLIDSDETDDDSTCPRATRAAWNGSAYQCPLCNAEFGSLISLKQHLASPRHQEKIYVCPLSSCAKMFSTLSGLCQHIESESCDTLEYNRWLKNIVSGVLARVKRFIPPFAM